MTVHLCIDSTRICLWYLSSSEVSCGSDCHRNARTCRQQEDRLILAKRFSALVFSDCLPLQDTKAGMCLAFEKYMDMVSIHFVCPRLAALNHVCRRHKPGCIWLQRGRKARSCARSRSSVATSPLPLCKSWGIGPVFREALSPVFRRHKLMFTLPQRYKDIVKFKTAFYSFYLPVASGLILAGVSNDQALKETQDICLAMGEYFQIQDDVLDCYADPETLGAKHTCVSCSADPETLGAKHTCMSWSCIRAVMWM